MSKRKLQPDCNLYLVLDTQVADYDRLLEITRLAVSTGVDIVQLRDKTGSTGRILSFSKKIQKILQGRIPYIINDRPELAAAAEANGVHLGQDDPSIKNSRRQLGDEAIIGVSCQTWEHVLAAQDNGADYIGFGSVFKTKTKPDRELMDLGLLEKILKKSTIPVFAIGGINLENVKPLIDLGVTRIAVTRAILEAGDVKGAVKEFKEILNAGVGILRE